MSKKAKLFEKANSELDEEKLGYWLSYCYGKMEPKMGDDDLADIEIMLKHLKEDDNE